MPVLCYTNDARTCALIMHPSALTPAQSRRNRFQKLANLNESSSRWKNTTAQLESLIPVTWGGSDHSAFGREARSASQTITFNPHMRSPPCIAKLPCRRSRGVISWCHWTRSTWGIWLSTGDTVTTAASSPVLLRSPPPNGMCDGNRKCHPADKEIPLIDSLLLVFISPPFPTLFPSLVQTMSLSNGVCSGPFHLCMFPMRV